MDMYAIQISSKTEIKIYNPQLICSYKNKMYLITIRGVN